LLPLVLALLGNAFVGARHARRKLGRPMTSDQRARVALWFAGGLVVFWGGITVLAMTAIAAKNYAFVQQLAAPSAPLRMGLTLAIGYGAIALLQYLLLSLFNPR